MKMMTVTMCSGGEIRINDGAAVRVFANATYAAEELARLMATNAAIHAKEIKVRQELNTCEKVDGTTVDLIANVRRILDEGVPF